MLNELCTLFHITYHCTVHQLCAFIIQSSVFHLSSVLYSNDSPIGTLTHIITFN